MFSLTCKRYELRSHFQLYYLERHIAAWKLKSTEMRVKAQQTSIRKKIWWKLIVCLFHLNKLLFFNLLMTLTEKELGPTRLYVKLENKSRKLYTTYLPPLFNQFQFIFHDFHPILWRIWVLTYVNYIRYAKLSALEKYQKSLVHVLQEH